MATRALTIDGKRIRPHKAIVSPSFTSKTVLAVDTWDYVHLWLQRRRKKEALFYWDQACHFYDATRNLPNTSAPLTAYYCFLNAAKALLSYKEITVAEEHGVAGRSTGTKASLTNEIVCFKRGGVLGGLCRYLGETTNDDEYSLKDILYNLPFIHRAYTLTFSSQGELFFPISDPLFVAMYGSNEAWFCAEITDYRYKNEHFVNKLPTGFEKDRGITEKFIIRRKQRFKWRRGPKERSGSLQRLTNYHKRLRAHLFYIHGPTRLWYIKRGEGPEGMIARASLTLSFAAMHRLSELARYNPMLLGRHLESQHNWLLSEFIATAKYQFIDEISSEITGQEFMVPGRRGAAP